jgi:hypothetical protein
MYPTVRGFPTGKVTVTFSSAITIDAALGNVFDITATGNFTLDITNMRDGQTILIRVRQDATGSRVWTLNSKFRLPGSSTSPLLLSTAASAKDHFVVTYDQTDNKFDISQLLLRVK